MWLQDKWDQSTMLFVSPFAGTFWSDYGAEITLARVIGLKWTFMAVGLTMGAGKLTLFENNSDLPGFTLDADRVAYLRVAPEMRFGWTRGRVVVYGLAGVGAGVTMPKATAYFSPNVGVGLAVLLWKGLFVGAETGLRFDHENVADISMTLGWKFG